jgi:hypothetical protein
MATCHCVRALKGKIVDILFIYHNCIVLYLVILSEHAASHRGCVTLLTAMETPRTPPPAEDPEKYQSSPVKATENVGIHNREDVAKKIVPRLLKSVSEDDFLKLLDDQSQDRGPIDFKGDFVSILNALSQDVGLEEERK